MLPAQSPESRTVARLQCVIHLAVLLLRLHDLFRQTDLDPDIRLHLGANQVRKRGYPSVSRAPPMNYEVLGLLKKPIEPYQMCQFAVRCLA
jgi:hypothetical protein